MAILRAPPARTWSVADGNHSMSIRLDSVGIHDIADEIFSAGFE